MSKILKKQYEQKRELFKKLLRSQFNLNAETMKNKETGKWNTNWVYIDKDVTEWVKYIVIEAGELLASTGFHWKKDQVDFTNIAIEAVDNIHFLLSHYMRERFESFELKGSNDPRNAIFTRMANGLLRGRFISEDYSDYKPLEVDYITLKSDSKRANELRRIAIVNLKLKFINRVTSDFELSENQFYELFEILFQIISYCMPFNKFKLLEKDSLIELEDIVLEYVAALYVGKNTLNTFRQLNGYGEGKYNKIWGGKEDNYHLVKCITDHTFSNNISIEERKEIILDDLTFTYLEELTKSNIGKNFEIVRNKYLDKYLNEIGVANIFEPLNEEIKCVKDTYKVRYSILDKERYEKEIKSNPEYMGKDICFDIYVEYVKHMWLVNIKDDSLEFISVK